MLGCTMQHICELQRKCHVTRVYHPSKVIDPSSHEPPTRSLGMQESWWTWCSGPHLDALDGHCAEGWIDATPHAAKVAFAQNLRMRDPTLRIEVSTLSSDADERPSLHGRLLLRQSVSDMPLTVPQKHLNASAFEAIT